MTEKRMRVHQKIFDIPWGDMDALGHVNNARYFDYFQEARIEWLRVLNVHLTQQIGPVVIHVDCTFLKPVVYPATIKINSYLHSIGNSSMIMDHELYQGDVLMAKGSSKIVWVDYIKGKSLPLPEIFRSLL
jgi:acyl-CoA thioester hydrolase